MDFWCSVSQRGDDHVVRLFGELDVASAETARAVLLDVAGSAVVADLSSLTFCDARGLGALLGAQDEIRARGHELRLVGACGMVRLVFAVCGLEDRLEGPSEDPGRSGG